MSSESLAVAWSKRFYPSHKIFSQCDLALILEQRKLSWEACEEYYKEQRMSLQLESKLAIAVEALKETKWRNIDLTAQMNRTLSEVCPNEDCDYVCRACTLNCGELDTLNLKINEALKKLGVT